MDSSNHHFKTTSTVSGFGVRFLNGLYNGLYPGLYGLYDGLYVSIVMGRDMGRCLCGGLDAQFGTVVYWLVAFQHQCHKLPS